MSIEEVITQLREIQRSSGRVFDQQFFASNKAIDKAIQLLRRPKGEWKQVCWKSPIPIEVIVLFHYKCDNCNKEVRIDGLERYSYCPHCGIDMRQ